MQSENSLHRVFGKVMRLHFIRSHCLLEKTAIYPGQPPLLFSLYRQNGKSQKELADDLQLKPATITVMIRRLEKTQVIERKQDENDQRISRIFITQKGIDVCKKLIEINNEIEKESFQGFTEEEKDSFRMLLIRVRDNLDKACEKEKGKIQNKEIK